MGPWLARTIPSAGLGVFTPRDRSEKARFTRALAPRQRRRADLMPIRTCIGRGGAHHRRQRSNRINVMVFNET